jgi:two-component system sensor histidine kinase ChvG
VNREPGAGLQQRLDEQRIDELRPDEGLGAEPAQERKAAAGAARRSWAALRALPSSPRAKRRVVALRAFWRGFVSRFSSSLARRIILLNIGGLFALLIGFLYLNQFRQGLIDARIQSLSTQAEIIAAAIAASATVDADAITIDPERLLKLAPGQSYGLDEESQPGLEFSINPDRVGPLLRRLVSPTRTRARIYDRDGYLLLDSRSIATRSTILRNELPPPGQEEGPRWLEWLRDLAHGKFNSEKLPLYEDIGVSNGRAYPEVATALDGHEQSFVRVNARGETVVTVAAPIQRFRTVRGALLLSTQGSDIDEAIAGERRALVRIFLVAAAVMFLLSAALAGTIAEPMRKLAEAADRVRRGVRSRQEIPDYTDRNDEIGHLSGALRDMTRALFNRIEAIERFAADVAHELKNPLTSLRSAVETLPIAKTESSRGRLLEVIEHDVRRLDRLISDISDASRLDAELARGDRDPIDVKKLLRALVDVANQVEREDGVTLRFKVEGSPQGSWMMMGHDSRLGQVFNNLFDNARTFSVQGGEVRATLRRGRGPGADGQPPRNGFEIFVDDDGPGIPDHAVERIFERFYTDRPSQSFGQNSGLGLSISRQIVEAHGGTIHAANRLDGEGQTIGARFVVFLPSAE